MYLGHLQAAGAKNLKMKVFKMTVQMIVYSRKTGKIVDKLYAKDNKELAEKAAKYNKAEFFKVNNGKSR